MKKTLLKGISLAFLWCGTVLTAAAQGIVVKKTDGTKIYYKASDVQSVGVYGYGEGPDDDIVEHPCVDLGLPSGTLWATCNIGAESPEEYGDYFAWGEIKPKSEYSENTYKYYDTTYEVYTKYCTNMQIGTIDNKTELESEDDAATVNWGIDWQMPSIEQLKELINDEYTTQSCTKLKGVDGLMIISRINGNRIFLPVPGYYNGTEHLFSGSNGYYLSRSLNTSENRDAKNLLVFKSYGALLEDGSNNYDIIHFRSYGQSVRPVRVKE